MIWLIPILLFLVVAYVAGWLEENDHFFWSNVVCAIGGIAVAAAITKCYYLSVL